MKRPHLLRRFRNSLRGLRVVWRMEPPFRARVILALAALVLALIVGLGATELSVVFASACVMLFAEIANTAIEEVCDIVQPQFDPRIGAIKDMLSATVFVAALPLIAITLFEILPRLIEKI